VDSEKLKSGIDGRSMTADKTGTGSRKESGIIQKHDGGGIVCQFRKNLSSTSSIEDDSRRRIDDADEVDSNLRISSARDQADRAP
jgi:hypothetical protein